MALHSVNNGTNMSAPKIQHSFDGDVKILNATFDRRMEMRQALTALQQDLQRLESRPTEIKAEIKLCVGGSEPRFHSYTVSITSSDFDGEEFARLLPSARSQAPDTATSAQLDLASPPTAAKHVNGQQATPSLSTPRPESRKADEDDDVIEVRPFKRPRTDADGTSSTLARGQGTEHVSKQRTAQIDELLSFIKEWRGEWVRQGGWLFDNITKATTTSAQTSTALDKKLDLVQDVLGQSMNSASASAMTELTNLSKLVPWLEHCRKTSADKVQAREEKWRSSSATFHDQTRREREAAEKRLERKLEEQRELLLKVARATGVDMGDADVQEGVSPERSREESLGAQLTAELNMEAAKASNAARSNAEREPIDVDSENEI